MNTQRMNYDYRSAKVAGIWIVIALCAIGIVYAFNAYRVEALSKFDTLAKQAQQSTQSSGGGIELSPGKEKDFTESDFKLNFDSGSNVIEAAPSDDTSTNYTLPWSVKDNLDGCYANVDGGFDCPDGHVIGIDSSGHKIYDNFSGIDYTIPASESVKKIKDGFKTRSGIKSGK